jgi:hypothetical protein
MKENKIFVSEYGGEGVFSKTSHFVIVVAASNSIVAKQYVKEKIGIEVEPVWLMNASYPVIYTQNGSTPLELQAKILYNGNSHTR